MPEIERAGVRLHFVVSGVSDGEVLVLANSIGSSLQMWDKVLPWFESRYRVVRFDMRGHGRSSVPAEPYSIGSLGGDVLLLLDALSAGRVNFCGLSLGGLVAMWLGIHAPHRIRRLILANTAARIGTQQMWNSRIENVRQNGMAAITETSLTRWFTPQYRDGNPQEMEKMQAMIQSTSPEGYAACCGVLRDTDLHREIASIAAPCLVIAGTYDPATSPSDGRALQHQIRNARYVELAASHLSAWECPEQFASEVIAFVESAEVRHG